MVTRFIYPTNGIDGVGGHKCLGITCYFPAAVDAAAAAVSAAATAAAVTPATVAASASTVAASAGCDKAKTGGQCFAAI